MAEEIIDAILSARYFQEGETSWNDVSKRVSDFIGNDDYQREKFYDLIQNCKFLPNSPTLMNAGRKNAQLNACFVLPVEDSMEDIFDAIKNTALIHKTGGGTGFCFSKLRGKNARVKSTNGCASGVVSFMRVFDEATEAVKQGGTRRGANMGVLHVDHPDILDFINCKSEEGKITNFNLSVMLTKEFIDHVSNFEWNAVITQSYNSDGTRNDITVKQVWDGLIYGMWKNGEPSCLFDDNINDTNMLKHLGRIIATNPCGEQLLFDNESCNLGSMNLSKYVEHGNFIWDEFKEDVVTAYYFLNNVVDKNTYPIDEITKMSHKTRRIGLGIMGYHDALLKMRVCYDSEEALKFLWTVLKTMKKICIEESSKLAKKDGCFDVWNGSVWAEEGIPMRNGALLSIAPTGSISLLANCSSSLEPVFNWVYQRNNTVGKSFLMVHPLFEADLKLMCKNNDELYNKIINQVFADGTLQNVKEIPDKVKNLYKCALDITPIWHLKTLSMAQFVVDASISKTINLTENTTKEDIENIVLLAHKMGCKGVTVYRTNSRKDVVMASAKHNESGFVEVIKDGEIYVKCPECGSLTKGRGGCNTCVECGYTKCS